MPAPPTAPVPALDSVPASDCACKHVTTSETGGCLHEPAQAVDCTEEVQSDDQMQPEPGDQMRGPDDEIPEASVARADGPRKKNAKRRRCEPQTAYRKFMRKAFAARRRVDVTGKDAERHRLDLAHTLLRGKSVPPKIEHI
jgi:hypothetical protein